MTDDDSLLRVKTEAQRDLFRIPGVRAVAIGHKYVGGTNTGQVAIIVKVDKKRPASAVAPGELIPAHIQGIPTDVVEWERAFNIGALVNDQSKERPLVGGTYIVVEYEDIDPVNRIITRTTKFGTLGFIARTTGAIAGFRPAVLWASHASTSWWILLTSCR